jgi:hypothetical protein
MAYRGNRSVLIQQQLAELDFIEHDDELQQHDVLAFVFDGNTVL